jgi:hypothetical protein
MSQKSIDKEELFIETSSMMCITRYLGEPIRLYYTQCKSLDGEWMLPGRLHNFTVKIEGDALEGVYPKGKWVQYK